jgi:hypothetical protein
MLRSIGWLVTATASIALAGQTAQADEMNVRDTPIKVTATFNALDEGGYAAEIAVHNGPIANLVHSTLPVNSATKAQRLILKQVQWKAPYLFVHSSCGGGRSLNCEGEAVFKLIDGVATRLGDVIGDGPDVFAHGQFVDVYDKLEGKSGDIEPTPNFVLVLDDDNGRLVVNAYATWQRNDSLWNKANQQLAAPLMGKLGIGSEHPHLNSALISGAALARYCNQDAELQVLLDKASKSLSADELRVVTDVISKVIPSELPKTWRKPY